MDTIPSKYRIRENATVLVIFFVAVHLLYFNTWQAGFVTDFTGLQERLDGAPFRDFLTCFGFPALHQVTNFFLFLFYKMFGTSALPWYLVYTSLHIVNGWLGYLLVKKILGKNTPQEQQRKTIGEIGTSFLTISLPAFTASLLFLLSPYNAEAVIWKVCFNFLFCTCMMLSSLLLLVKYLENRGKRGDLLWFILFFVIALFTFELALTIPFIAVAFACWWPKKENEQLASRPSLFLEEKIGRFKSSHPPMKETMVTGSLFRPFYRFKIFAFFFSLRNSYLLIPFVIAGLYFSLNKILLGGWVGHYGEGVHLNFEIRNIASNLLKYFSKNLIYWREWEHGAKQALIAFCDNPATAYAFILICFTLLLTGIVFYKKITYKIKTVAFAWLLFFTALLPVANLYVVWLLHGENDRYGYFASLFFYLGLVGLFQVFNNKIKYFLYTIFLSLSIFNLIKINSYWKNSAAVVHSLLDDFKWENNSEIYVLAFPENYKGIPMFKDFSRQDLALKSTLKYLANKPTTGKFYQIAQFNMNTPSDGLTAKVDSGNVIKLEFREWGSWWWRHGLGTGSYETDQYEFKDAPKGCEITIKNAAIDAAFIYSDGGEWREIKF